MDTPEETKAAPGPVSIKPRRHDPSSAVLGVSLRGWLAIILTMTFCGLAWRGQVTPEAFSAVASNVIAFYFGQKVAEAKATP